MGNILSAPTKNKTVRFAYLDTIMDAEGRIKSETEWTGEAEIVSAYHHDGVRDTEQHFIAHLICAYDEQGNEFLNFGDQLADALCDAALEAFYNPPRVPIIFPHEQRDIMPLVQIEDGGAGEIIAVGSLPIIANEADRDFWGCQFIQRISLIGVGRHLVVCNRSIPAGLFKELNALAAKMAA